MGILDRLANRAVDRAVDTAVDKAVTKTVDKVVDETLGKAVQKTATEQAERMITEETEIATAALLHCSKCGAVITKEDSVCPDCGEAIEPEKIQAIEELERNKAESLEAIEKEKAEKEQQQTEKKNPQSDSKFVLWLKKQNDTKDTTADYDKAEIDATKTVCVFSYLFWLVLIPLFGAKESKFARFHANQGIVLAIAETAWFVLQIIVNALLGGIPFLGWLLSFAMSLVDIVFAVLMIVGILNVLNGKAKELPVIGKYRILK